MVWQSWRMPIRRAGLVAVTRMTMIYRSGNRQSNTHDMQKNRDGWSLNPELNETWSEIQGLIAPPKLCIDLARPRS
jgi:hypothetical protein